MQKLLENDLETGNISHAYLLECKNIDLGTKMSEDFAKAIFTDEGLENNPDFKMIFPDDKAIKIEQIREIQKDMNIKPIKYDKKIYIISEADKMTEQSQNCILKTLEEPPGYIVIILVASSAGKLLGTISSRVKKIRIEESYEGTTTFIKAEELINKAQSASKVDILNHFEFFETNKDEIDNILEYILLYCNTLIKNFMLSGEEKSGNISLERVAKYIEIIEETKQRLNKNCNFGMTIDRMLIKFSENV
jgi:DNA polymerase-3 subunit delta'